MEFKVRFGGDFFVSDTIGLEEVDLIRKEKGNVPLEEIEEESVTVENQDQYEIYGYKRRIVIVSEDFVRRHYSLFEKRNRLEVRVNSFERFFYKVVGDKGEGCSPRYFIYYKLDEKFLLAAWEKAGCPEEM